MCPEVSVIIPAYNTARYIERAVRSALAQTIGNLEVIVVDDASTDGTAAVVRNIADPRVELIVNSENVGAAAARNRAIAAARGNWIALLDSDDWYAPERLEKLLAVARSSQATMVADDLNLIREGEAAPWSTLIAEGGLQRSEPIVIEPAYFVRTDRYGQKGLHLGFTKPIIERDFLLERGIEYDTGVKVTHDFWLYLRCLISGARFVLLPKAYYFQRLRAGSLVSSSQIRRLSDDLAAVNQFLSLDAVQQDPELTAALVESKKLFQLNSDYYAVVEPLRAGKWSLALGEMFRRPRFFRRLLGQFPQVVWSFLYRYIFKRLATA